VAKSAARWSGITTVARSMSCINQANLLGGQKKFLKQNRIRVPEMLRSISGYAALGSC
jgi:hypothetical protein